MPKRGDEVTPQMRNGDKIQKCTLEVQEKVCYTTLTMDGTLLYLLILCFLILFFSFKYLGKLIILIGGLFGINNSWKKGRWTGRNW